MNSGTPKPGPQSSKTGPGGYPAAAPSNQAILLDKLNVRRSTPDSEALASSDDESDIHRQDNAPSSVQPAKPARRSSWLNDTSQPVAPPRKGSFASSSMSPTTSHPSTPAAESGVGTWASHSTPSVMNRGHPGTSSFPWGTGIWNSERKEPPSRLQEVLPSPTSSMPPSGSNAFFPNENGLSQALPTHKDASNPQIPFAIPLHPTPKTYRSQSYSVGQLEPDLSATSLGQSMLGNRGRMLGHSGLQHRPSRPSMLSEMASDGTMLGKVTEDDDDEGSNGSMPGNQHQSAEAAKTIEMLSRENAMLRQQQYQNLRLRSRASTTAAYSLGNGHLQESVPEESEYAIDEMDDGNDGSDMSRRLLGRRMSEYGAVPFRTPLLVENRKLENVKKGFWQTSLGFGVSGLVDIPQSRRHSFADVSTRQGSISSISEVTGVHEATAQEAAYPDYSATYPDSSNFPVTSQVSAFYNGNTGMHGLQSPVYSNPYGLAYAALNPYAHRPSSPPRNMYGMAAPRQNQTLHVVLFKCARADVFYIQEGTGLTIKPGDLVIVEADRGTDLGTVAKDNVDWPTAKELKEHYAEEQYKWLMMYSQNAAAAQDGAGAGLLAGSSSLQASAVGGMGPPGQHHMQEVSSGELKPKLIKRLAQSHEIHALRDKEGNEAKAKRVCMQKVKEHGLNMEILDAEFQMDWKKLTFYYFADSYINFNSLVTDLFKIYKTRIWMSAINPASFASPTLGLQAPSGIGPGAIGVGRGSSVAQRRQDQQQDPQTNYGGANQQARGAQPSYGHSFPADRTGITAGAFPASGYAYNPYGAFGNVARPGNSPFGPNVMGVPDTFPAGYTQASVTRFTASQTSGGQLDQGGLSLGTQADWVAGSFQGLSLNSR